MQARYSRIFDEQKEQYRSIHALNSLIDDMWHHPVTISAFFWRFVKRTVSFAAASARLAIPVAPKESL
jgi:hypothetical protein